MIPDKSEIERMIKSNFPKLMGIDFSKVLYDENINLLNPNQDLFSDVNGKWNFAVSSSPMIFNSFSSDKISVNLEKLLLINQISFDDKYSEKGNENIDFWDGDGFKIEKTLINEVNVIIITHANVYQKSFQTFNSTNLATPIPDSLDWIEGFESVYDESSINSKDLSACINVPFLFKDKLKYILIPISDNDLGKIIIDYLIVNNGGVDSYKQEDVSNNEDWEILYNGYGFNIGIYQEGNFIRIEKNISSKIHPLSKKIQSNIEGFGHQIFFKGDEVSTDGRFTAEDIECLDSVAFFEVIQLPIKIFKNIVLLYNNDDKFLSINDDSIVEIFNREADGDIIFDVEGKFRMKLTKNESHYQLNLFPPGGIYGSWDDLNEEEYNGSLPEVQFSYFSEEPVLKNYEMKEPKKEETLEEKKEKEINQKKEAFLQESVIPPDEVIPAQQNQSNGPKDNIVRNLLWIMLVIFLISLLYRSCNTNQDYFQIGVDYFDEGNSEEGFEYLNKAIDQDNQHIDALMRRGREYMNAEEYQNAEYDFSEVITLDPNNWEAYYLRGRSYMGQAQSKWSPLYEKAINDFTKSIELNSTSKNANSFYYRGDVREISEEERSGCADFVKACDLGSELGCDRYDTDCYPQTGYMPYKKYFGEGLFTGDNLIYLNNTQSTTDALVVVRNINTGVKVRSQFIRKGEELTMNNIPNGYFEIKSLTGNNWAYDEMMPDGETKGGFKMNQEVKMTKNSLDLRRCQLCEFSTTLYLVEGGNAGIPENIDFNEFME
jgi:tetratricopeptide (TPR) repeat protein